MGLSPARTDSSLRVNAFNHASVSLATVAWTGQSTAGTSQGFRRCRMTQARLHKLCSPLSARNRTWERFAATPKKVLLSNATY